MSELTLESLKGQWNQVLDLLLEEERTLWLLFFDARLESLSGNTLRISFIDSEKFGGDHNFKSARKSEQTAKLVVAIKKITGESLEVVE